MSSILRMMFLAEATPVHQAQAELNRSTSVAQSPRRYTPSTAKMQSDVDSGSSVAKKNEGADASGAGLRITGDRATLEALEQALEMVGHAHADEDLAEWADQASSAISQAVSGRANAGNDGNVTLPPFKTTPSLDDFNDEGPGPEDEEY